MDCNAVGNKYNFSATFNTAFYSYVYNRICKFLIPFLILTLFCSARFEDGSPCTDLLASTFDALEMVELPDCAFA